MVVVDAFQIFQIFSISAIGIAVATILINRRHRKADNIKVHLEHKLRFYGSLLFQFDKMRFTHETDESLGHTYKDKEHPGAERYSYSSKEGESIFQDINDEIKSNYSLFSQDLMRSWVEIRTLWYNPIVIEKAPQFRKALVDVYNETVERYKKITGIDLEPKS